MEHNKIIIIPTYNELNSLKRVILNCPKKWKILILDDCSKDKTIKWLKKNKISFIKNNQNLGYEKNLIKGFEYVLKQKKYKLVATIDADGEHDPKFLDKMKNKIKLQKLDMIIAEREKYNRISEAFIGKLYKKKFNISDPLSGYKIYKTKTLEKILPKIKNIFFLVDIINLMISQGKKIGTIRIKSNKRKFGKPKVGGGFIVNFKIFFLISILFLIR